MEEITRERPNELKHKMALCARIFGDVKSLIDKGYTPYQIMTELKLSPELAVGMYQKVTGLTGDQMIELGYLEEFRKTKDEG